MHSIGNTSVRVALQCLLVVTVFCLFLPLLPVLPSGEALDPSWMIGINQAVTQKMKFGQEMIFTFGPYASIYTRAYHPATEHLELIGSAYLAVLYAIALIGALKHANLITLLGIWLLLAGFTSSNDCLFFSYGLLVGVYAQQIILQDQKDNSWALLHPALLVILFSGFGLYPLIKGTLFAFYFSIAALAFMFCCWRRKWVFAVIIPVSIALSTLFFWNFAGQNIQDIPAYFLSISSIIAGYTDAMSITGNEWEIVSYAITSILLLLYMARIGGINVRNLYLLLLFSLFLFINFKAGFVRHDSHSLMCGVAILFAAILVLNLFPSKTAPILVALAVITLIQTEISHKQFNLGSIISQAVGTYSKTIDGAKLRLTHHDQLDAEFKASLQLMAQKHPLPILTGKSDIYPFDQMFLIASGNEWVSRPILQSYSVYNPKLSSINSEFLHSDRAPDNIFFRVQSIDERYPSSDDGKSWLALMTLYTPSGFAGDYLILKKRAGASETLVSTETLTSTQSLTSWVDLPKSNDKIFAKIEIEHTLLGQLKNLFFKSSPLGIAVRLQDGTIKYYRLIADIAKSEFLLSPFIENAQEFNLLYQDPGLLKQNQVDAISIWVEGNAKDWQKTYKLKLESFK
jgi:hypothetical protein